jgi:PAS domain S-box-containing protein
MRELGPRAIGAYAALRSQIVAGEWPSGTQLPNQTTLASSLGVAPLTLRQALDRLEAEGMISRKSRHGTFVQRPTAGTIPGLDEMFELLFRHSPLGVSVVDSTGCLLKSNSAFQRLLGYDATELAGKYMRDYSYPDDLPRQALVVAESIEQRRSSFQIEKRYIRSDGDVIWCRLIVYSIGIEGELVGAVSVLEEIPTPTSAG